MPRVTPASRQASIMRRASRRSRAMGFSQRTCLPAAAAARVCSQWVSVGVETMTASTAASPMRAAAES